MSEITFTFIIPSMNRVLIVFVCLFFNQIWKQKPQSLKIPWTLQEQITHSKEITFQVQVNLLIDFCCMTDVDSIHGIMSNSLSGSHIKYEWSNNLWCFVVCSRSSTRGDRSKSRDKSHDRSKSRDKSAERERTRDSRDRDVSKSRSRSKSPAKSEPRSRSRSKSRSKSR